MREILSWSRNAAKWLPPGNGNKPRTGNPASRELRVRERHNVVRGSVQDECRNANFFERICFDGGEGGAVVDHSVPPRSHRDRSRDEFRNSVGGVRIFQSAALVTRKRVAKNQSRMRAEEIGHEPARHIRADDRPKTRHQHRFSRQAQPLRHPGDQNDRAATLRMA